MSWVVVSLVALLLWGVVIPLAVAIYRRWRTQRQAELMPLDIYAAMRMQKRDTIRHMRQVARAYQGYPTRPRHRDGR